MAGFGAGAELIQNHSADIPTLQDDWSDFTQSRPLYGGIGPHLLRTPVLLSDALLAHDVHVCPERPSSALPPDYRAHGKKRGRGLVSRRGH